MLPDTLALVDDDRTYAGFLAEYLRERGTAVQVYEDSNDLLIDPAGYDHGFYLLDLSLPGVDGLDLIRLLRRRTQVGIVVVSGRLSPEVFHDVVTAGADMYLCKPVQFEQVLLTVQAVHRRVAPPEPSEPVWRLDRRARDLVAPDGSRISLSNTDLAVMECFLAAAGKTVSREALLQRLGREPQPEGGDGLNATIYRLRRRIEKSTPAQAPLQAKARVGYLFNAPLQAA